MSFNSLFYSACLTVGVAISCWGASPAIGIVTASGHFTLEKSQVWGNSTLFEGSTVETDVASSQLALQNGVRVQLGSESRARVWNDRVLLEKGVGQVAAPESYEVDAGGLAIRSTSAGARVRVGLAANGRVEVTALAGGARVMGAGLLLATIPGGRSMSFSMQAAAPGQSAATGSVTRAGCLLYKDGHVLLQDDDTREVVELLGSGLNPNVGNRVEVAGNASAAKPALAIATSVLNVTAVTLKEQGGCLSVAAALDARTEVPSGGSAGSAAAQAANTTPSSAPKTAASTGMSTGAKVAIIAAVAGGGAGAAIVVAGSKKPTSP